LTSRYLMAPNARRSMHLQLSEEARALGFL
jgi:hypothetical protein